MSDIRIGPGFKVTRGTHLADLTLAMILIAAVLSVIAAFLVGRRQYMIATLGVKHDTPKFSGLAVEDL